MQNRSILTPTLGIIAVLVACTACSATQSSGASTTAPTAPQSEAPTPTATPTAEPLDPADPSSWTIDFAGVGPLTRGGSISAESPGMSAFVDGSNTEACSLVVFDALAEDVPDIFAVPGADLDTSDELVVSGNGKPAPFVTGSPTTEAGIGIGATEGELIAAYPEVASEPGPSPDTLKYSVTDGAGGYINFTVDPSRLVESIAISGSDLIPYEYCG